MDEVDVQTKVCCLVALGVGLFEASARAVAYNDVSAAGRMITIVPSERVSPHFQGPRLPVGRARRNGADVTAKFRSASEARGGI
jgi:hypothetical protein